jgi:electron transfer flavoprotein alpha subunit
MGAVHVLKEKCIGCEQCVIVCPFEALFMKDGVVVVEEEKCRECRKCLPVCPTESLYLERRAEREPAPPHGIAEISVELPAKLIRYKGIWVMVEQQDGKPHPVSWELMGEGLRMAQKLGVELAAVILGENVKHLSKEAFYYGADKVYLIEDPALSDFRTYPYTFAMTKLVNKYKPEILLMGATSLGRDLAGAVATSLNTGLTADCTKLDIDDRTKVLLQTRPAFGGNIMATIICANHRPQMATVRPRVMARPYMDDARTGTLVEESLGLSEDKIRTKFVEFIPDELSNVVNLEDADVIVAGGRGVGSAEGFNVLKELADALGGEIATSRGPVESGWISSDYQVGQTGKTVRPKIYFACGISGAIQHVVGMQNADVIVAINTDPDAPIFNVATYGIVGDIFKVVPEITNQFKKRKGVQL